MSLPEDEQKWSEGFEGNNVVSGGWGVGVCAEDGCVALG